MAPELRQAAILTMTGALGCGDGDDRPSREEARSCLERLNLHVTVVEPLPDDRDAPDAELIANDVLKGRVMLFAGYYDDEDTAERYEPALRRNARSFDGAVERHGTLTLLWVRGDESRIAERVRDCLL